MLLTLRNKHWRVLQYVCVKQNIIFLSLTVCVKPPIELWDTLAVILFKESAAKQTERSSATKSCICWEIILLCLDLPEYVFSSPKQFTVGKITSLPLLPYYPVLRPSSRPLFAWLCLWIISRSGRRTSGTPQLAISGGCWKQGSPFLDEAGWHGCVDL